MSTARTLPYGGLTDRDPCTDTPLDRDPPWTENLPGQRTPPPRTEIKPPWTENPSPSDRDPSLTEIPWTETLLDREPPPDRDPSLTEIPRDRDPRREQKDTGVKTLPYCNFNILVFVFPGEIVAISLGSACLILVVGALVYWAWKLVKRRRAKNSEYEKILPSKQQAKPQQDPVHHVVAGDKQQVHPEKSGPTLRYVCVCVCVCDCLSVCLSVSVCVGYTHSICTGVAVADLNKKVFDAPPPRRFNFLRFHWRIQRGWMPGTCVLLEVQILSFFLQFLAKKFAKQSHFGSWRSPLPRKILDPSLLSMELLAKFDLIKSCHRPLRVALLL